MMKRWQSKLQKFNITAEMLQAGKLAINQMEALDYSQEKEKGDTQQVKRFRDEKLKAAESWYADYKQVARIVLKDTPEYLEKLGIKVPS